MKEELAIQLYQQGYSLRHIASTLHIDRKRLSNILKNTGISIRMQNITSKQYTCNEMFFDDINHNSIGDQLAGIDVGLCLDTKLGAILNGSTQDVARRDCGDVEFCGNVLRLSTFSGAGSAHNDQIHNYSP
jgi:hypothetical protein